MRTLSISIIAIVTFLISLVCPAVETIELNEAKEAKDSKQQVITNSVGMKLRLIGPGEFIMGSDKGGEWDKQEKPAHKVKITKAFYIGVYEVTQEQYEKIMGKNPSSFKGAKLPVDSVDWKEAQEFCKKLSEKEKEGAIYFLPTEAQWEYACRAGSKTEYYWGDKMDNEYCWYTGTSEKKTHDVGTKKPNNFGLYDMSGNVYEICSDWYDENYYKTSPEEDPQGPEKGKDKAIRSGCWATRETYCRSASRVSFSQRTEMDRIGFRVCCTTSELSENSSPNDLVVTITKENEVFFQGNRINTEDDYKELKLKFRKASSEEKNVRLIVEADVEVKYGIVMEIISLALDEGISNCALATKEKIVEVKD